LRMAAQQGCEMLPQITCTKTLGELPE